jgi:hypothetical protein
MKRFEEVAKVGLNRSYYFVVRSLHVQSEQASAQMWLLLGR